MRSLVHLLLVSGVFLVEGFAGCSPTKLAAPTMLAAPKMFATQKAPSLVTLAVQSTSEDTPKYNHDNPRFFNSHGFRAAAVLATLYGVGYASGAAQSPLQLLASRQAMATLHLLSFGVWFGSIVYSTFVGGITMVKNLPRPMFGKVQSKLFPKFFKLCTASILVELATLPRLSPTLPTKIMQQLLLGSLVATLLNVVLFGPKTTDTMKIRMDLEQEVGGKESAAYKKANDTFMMYHGLSSIANLLAMCGAVGYALQLARALV